MRHQLIAAAIAALPSLPASATVYTGISREICVCQKVDGYSGIDQFLSDEPTEVCRTAERDFEPKAVRRTIIFSSHNLEITFKQVRPYFSDLDWYHSGATGKRGQINLYFKNENPQSSIRITQMVQGSGNRYEWSLSGSCGVNE